MTTSMNWWELLWNDENFWLTDENVHETMIKGCQLLWNNYIVYESFILINKDLTKVYHIRTRIYIYYKNYVYMIMYYYIRCCICTNYPQLVNMYRKKIKETMSQSWTNIRQNVATCQSLAKGSWPCVEPPHSGMIWVCQKTWVPSGKLT